jgi:hypothetical protein
MPKAPDLPPPVYLPNEVAKAILYAAQHPSRDMYVGGASRAFSFLNRVAPHLVDWVNAKYMSKQQQREEPSRGKNGALYQAGRDGNVRGEPTGHWVRPSLYTNAMTHPVAASLLLVAAGAAMAATIHSERSRS